MSGIPVYKTWLLLFILTCIEVYSPLYGQSPVSQLMRYAVAPSCDSPLPDKPTNLNQYYLELSIDTLFVAEEDIEIKIDGESILQLHIDKMDAPFTRLVGPFNHSGIGGTFHEYVLRSLTTGVADTLYLPEIVCGRTTSNGLNSAGYFCDEGNYGLVAQVTPEPLNVPALPEKTYVYVLIDKALGLVADRNFSGHFDGVEDLSEYEVHAFAVSFEEQADFINNIVIGQMLDQESLSICYALCGIYSVVVDCSSFDLSLSKTVRGGFVYSVGDLVVFDITVYNDGRITAYNVVVSDMKPDALDFVPDMNPYWLPDFTSLPIDSIAAGASVTIPIYMRVNGLAPSQEVINTAEIIFGASDPDSDTPAFDLDSTPDNEDEDEDDQDDEEIIILENLCATSFAIEADNTAVCLGGPLIIAAKVVRAAYPLTYTWRYEGEIVSRDSILIITDHQPSDYGLYSLTIIDDNQCTGTEFVLVEPIENQTRFACFNNVNVAVSGSCEIFIRPSMLTSRDDVSGLDDYIIEIRDEDNHLVDQNDLSQYGPGTTLEARILNPCTFETICWSLLNLEHTDLPDIDIYNSEKLVTMCPEIVSSDPTQIIEHYNATHDDPIYAAQVYADTFNQLTCLQQWEVETIDELSDGADACSDRAVWRIYYVYDQEQRLPIDTAVLQIIPIIADSIKMPDDINNLTCGEDLRPESLESYPSFYHQGVLTTLKNTYRNERTAICNIGITYADLELGEACSFGASKVVRKWTAVDWCTNTYTEDLQYLFIVDQDRPDLIVEESEVTILTPPFVCYAVIDIRDYVIVSDLCDPDPEIMVNEYTDPHRIELPIGEHELEVIARDKCGNQITESLVFTIREDTDPLVILKEDIVISLSPDTSIEANYIAVETLDAGSHDYECGPVQLSMARASELLLLASEGGRVPLDGDLRNCMLDLSALDSDSDGYVSVDEIYRNEVIFCCQDIGSDVPIVVRAIDGSGNYSEAEVSVFVDAKLGWTACDDGDVCTVDDKQYGECPCSGVPVIEDVDRDLIVDCQDSLITVCLDGTQRDVPNVDVQDWVEQGAVPGPCEADGLMASVAGEVFTTAGEYIEDVLVEINEARQDITSVDGYYRFDQNEMYVRYELYPERDDDHINGVTTLDLVILQEYILGERTIVDPYLLIAADVNNDGKISALDIVELRKVLLGKKEDFTNNRSWRFVIEDYEFEDITRPYDYQEVNVISSLAQDMMEEDWIGIKIGDMNGSAKANRLKSSNRSAEAWTIAIPNMHLEEGDEIDIPISAGTDISAMGLQVDLFLAGLSFEAMRSSELDISSDQFDVSDDVISIVWHDNLPHDLSGDLFYIALKAQESGRLQDMISLQEEKKEALVATVNYADIPVVLEFSESISIKRPDIVELYQNQPNPFNGETIIQFYIPHKGEVRLSFFDNRGRQLHEVTQEYTAGINAIRLTHDDLALFEGVIYYQMSYQNQLYSRRMIISN